MPGTIPAARQHLIDEIARRSRSPRAARLPVALAGFIQAYYRGVDEEDLRTTEAPALAAAAAGHLRFGATRRPGQPLVRVFNPTLAADGWESPHTCVEVVTDDMPFLIDSLALVLNESGLAIQMMVHPVLRAQRDGRGRLQHIDESAAASGRPESWQHIVVRRASDPARLEEVRGKILAMLDDVRVAVLDWPAMRARALGIARSFASREAAVPRAEAVEAGEFLEWLADNHFTFLGYREYRLERGSSTDRLVPVPNSGLGLMRTGAGRPRPQATQLKGEIRRRAREVALLVVTKANSVSTVHRATYLDYIGVKTFDSRGRVNGERRFIGLFTSTTYSTSPREIPLLRHKVQRVIDQIGV
jgi:glutamate dehydrogenase